MERIFRLMAERNASDVYFSANAPVLIRVNGQCMPISTQMLPPEAPRSLLAEMVPQGRMAELERSGELNMALAIEGVGNFRISAMRQRRSYAVVARYIASTIPALDTLHLPEILKKLVMNQHGLILVIGTSGAGKSTTLASMLDYRNARAVGHILTVEEPIEFTFANQRSIVNQRDVGGDTATLQVALKNALRQVPDVIQIGDIRDRDTMAAALTCAQSGCLCLATLHARNAHHALNRILSFYPVDQRPTLLGDLAASLRATVAQRLLRTPMGPRLPAVEVMLNTPLISALVEKGSFSKIKEAMEKSTTGGSQTFEQDIARLILDNHVSHAEGLSQVDSASNLLWRLQNHNKPNIRMEDLSLLTDTDEPSFTDIALDVRF